MEDDWINEAEETLLGQYMSGMITREEYYLELEALNTWYFEEDDYLTSEDIY
jgi:hypothetical protein